MPDLGGDLLDRDLRFTQQVGGALDPAAADMLDRAEAQVLAGRGAAGGWASSGPRRRWHRPRCHSRGWRRCSCGERDPSAGCLRRPCAGGGRGELHPEQVPQPRLPLGAGSPPPSVRPRGRPPPGADVALAQVLQRRDRDVGLAAAQLEVGAGVQRASTEAALQLQAGVATGATQPLGIWCSLHRPPLSPPGWRRSAGASGRGAVRLVQGFDRGANAGDHWRLRQPSTCGPARSAGWWPSIRSSSGRARRDQYAPTQWR